VRLVISCHGAGGTVTTDDAQIVGQVMTRYLLANGYAVMDVNGLPQAYANEMGIDIRNSVGNPMAVESYEKAYAYCIEQFNLKREVFVHGGSMGGISSTNLVLHGKIPVMAQSGFCPVLDTYNQIFLKPWSDGLPKTALAKFYGFSKNGIGDYVYDENKVKGYNPMGRLVEIGGKEILSYPVPVKFWQCEDDGTVAIDCTKRFVKAINNAGGEAELITFPTGGHEPQDVGEALEKTVGIREFCGEELKISTAEEGVFVWILQYDSNNPFEI
jgi:S-formylglutathione hydrolase FrmB